MELLLPMVTDGKLWNTIDRRQHYLLLILFKQKHTQNSSCFELQILVKHGNPSLQLHGSYPCIVTCMYSTYTPMYSETYICIHRGYKQKRQGLKWL